MSDYSDWAHMLAKNQTEAQLKKEISRLEKKQIAHGRAHLRAIEKTTSMQGNSQSRAQSKNLLVGNYERITAHRHALELLGAGA